MIRLIRPARHRISQLHPRFDRFESRQLLSLSVVAIDPIPNARLSAPPGAVIVTFDRPIDPTSLSNADIQLNQVDDNGNLTWLSDATEAPGPNPDQIELTPGQALAPGQYRTILEGDSPIAGLDGVGLDGNDQALGDFWIVSPGVGLGDAIDLGTPGSTVTSTPGTLDFLANPDVVNLYKITLPPGHFWRLGVEVRAQRDGGTLDSALALFDAQGTLIAADDLGRSDAPKDPYLFAGLDAGTYYLGVSGEGDIPGTPVGYDPATATPGSVAPTQPGGPFTLQVVADPEDTPTRVSSLTLDHADPLDPVPTGLSLVFSGAIRLPTPVGGLADYLSNAIEVVDQEGHVWPLMAVNYSEVDARISFLFDDPLPPGNYTVRLPQQGGLVDLAGLAPVAPGQPAGVLGTFSITPTNTPRDPHDLGLLLPDAAPARTVVDTQLNPGDSVRYGFVVIIPGFYEVASLYSGGSFAMAIHGVNPHLTIPLNPGNPDLVDVTNDLYLMSGVYQLQLNDNGSQSVFSRVVFRTGLISPESILESGIGQGPGLSLRLIAPVVLTQPTPATTQPFSPIPSSTPASLSVSPATAPAPTPSPIFATATATQQVPLASVIGGGGDLVGRPSAETIPPATVVLGLQSGSTTLSEGLHIGQGIGSGARSRSVDLSDRSTLLKVDVLADAPADGAMASDAVVHNIAQVGAVPLNSQWLGRLGSAIARWFETQLGDDSILPDEIEDSWTQSGDVPSQARPTPVAAAQAGLTLRPGLRWAVFVLVLLSGYRMYRRINRESPRSRHVRKGIMTE